MVLLTVKLTVSGGRVVSVAEAGPGQLVGWSALAAPHAYFAEVVALTDGVVLALSAVDVEDGPAARAGGRLRHDEEDRGTHLDAAARPEGGSYAEALSTEA